MGQVLCQCLGPAATWGLRGVGLGGQLARMAREYVLQPSGAAAVPAIDYARELNPQQLEAISAPPGPALVIAGAGTGKTRTLIYRVAYLIEQGIPPERILLLTFTNKAASEMMTRVAGLLGGDVSGVCGGTFHSVANRVLRRHADRIGYPSGFTILDREDASDLMRTCVEDGGFDPKAQHIPKADVLCDVFSLAANTRRSLPDVLATDFDYLEADPALLGGLQAAFAARKKATGVVDFDDLLVLWLELLRADAEVRELYQRQFQFILVDEYQDTNLLQSELIDCLAGRHRNLMAVGDDAQSIYSWRGANYRNILEFEQRYPGARVYKIETNYRSTPQILAVANAVIRANPNQYEKHLQATRKPGPLPVLTPCPNTAMQACFVAQRIQELYDEGTPLREIAVLYRAHFHAMELQLELTRRGIPFAITSGLRFFEQAHVKDLTAFLRLVANPRDELAFKRILRMLPGIGTKTAAGLWERYVAALPPAASPVAGGVPGVAVALQKCGPPPKKAAVAWAQLCATLAQIEVPEARAQPARMLETVLEAMYEEYLQETYTNYRSRQEDLDQIAAFAHNYDSCEEFLGELSLLGGLEAEDAGAKSPDPNRVRLSTVHQAKGLEFDAVFVIMLCEGLFPSKRALESEDPETEPEERRLFYVAVTRARKELFLTYPQTRQVRGDYGDWMQEPSRFVGEIPQDLLETLRLRWAPRGGGGDPF